MSIKTYLNRIIKHPPSVLYGTLLGIVAFAAAIPMFLSGMYDAALVDLAMAIMLIVLMLKKFFSTVSREITMKEKCFAWLTVMHPRNLLEAYKTIFVQLDYGLWFLGVLFILTVIWLSGKYNAFNSSTFLKCWD